MATTVHANTAIYLTFHHQLVTHHADLQDASTLCSLRAAREADRGFGGVPRPRAIHIQPRPHHQQHPALALFRQVRAIFIHKMVLVYISLEESSPQSVIFNIFLVASTDLLTSLGLQWFRYHYLSMSSQLNSSKFELMRLTSPETRQKRQSDGLFEWVYL